MGCGSYLVVYLILSLLQQHGRNGLQGDLAECTFVPQGRSLTEGRNLDQGGSTPPLPPLACPLPPFPRACIVKWWSYQQSIGTNCHPIIRAARASVTVDSVRSQKRKNRCGGSCTGSCPGFQFPAQTWLGNHPAAARRLCPGACCSWIYPAPHQHHAPW